MSSPRSRRGRGTARFVTVLAIAVTAGVGGTTAAFAQPVGPVPADGPGPCQGTTGNHCGLENNDPRQGLTAKYDEYYHCNPHGNPSSPVAEDECANSYERTHPHDGPESDLPEKDRIRPQDSAPSSVYNAPTPNDLAKIYGAVTDKGPYGR